VSDRPNTDSLLPSGFNEIYDLIVIGGGINGAGVVRDAALRGLKAILIEKGDFCSGTTGWSTRLIHGGLRYLEYFELSLVRESLQEREILLQIAPHLVKPLLLTIPIYRDRSRPYWKIKVGMILYDILSSGKTLPSHRMLTAQQFQQIFRSINSENLLGGAQYYDAQVAYAERLVLENILSARIAGATVLNYTEVLHLNCKSDFSNHTDTSTLRIASLTCRNTLTGEEFIVSGSREAVIVNTSGPWVDEVLSRGRQNGMKVSPGSYRKIGGTKGSHILVDPFPGAPQESAFYGEAKSDGRPFFIVPWLGMVLIGTTDIRYTGNLDQVKASDEEIDYLLSETNSMIPAAQLRRQDVKFTYSGVRPLPYLEGKKPGSITRRHILYDHTAEGITNLISLIGGKITTYRQVGQEIVDAVYQKQGRKAPLCLTAQQLLPGAIREDDERIREAIHHYRDRLSPFTITHLFSIYGAKAPEVLALTDSEPELAEPVAPSLPDIKAQIIYAIQSEAARTLVDITHRRTALAMHSNYGFKALPAITETLKKYADWNQEECDRQIEDYYNYMRTHCIPDYQLSRNRADRH
jgi:glycerol-3-phosphate dehydrogenase